MSHLVLVHLHINSCFQGVGRSSLSLYQQVITRRVEKWVRGTRDVYYFGFFPVRTGKTQVSGRGRFIVSNKWVSPTFSLWLISASKIYLPQAGNPSSPESYSRGWGRAATQSMVYSYLMQIIISFDLRQSYEVGIIKSYGSKCILCWHGYFKNYG